MGYALVRVSSDANPGAYWRSSTNVLGSKEFRRA
jgi:hypothetical protein